MDRNGDVYHQIFACHPHATILFGLMDGLIEDANDAALALYGYGREEMIGLPFSALAAAPEAKLHKRKDGSMLAIEAHRSTLNIGGREVGVAVIRGMSGEGGAALDLGGILASILSLTEMAIADLPLGDPARLNLEEIRLLSLRAVDLSLPLKV